MKNSEIIRYSMYHQQQIKAANPNPSESTRLIWRLEDEHQQFLLECSEQEEAAARAKAEAEAAEDYTVKIKSEVKVK